MKIAILTPWSISPNAVGGTERFVMDLAESFSNLGNQVDVYMLSGKDYSKDGINYKNMNLFNSDDIINEYFLREKFNNFSEASSYEKLAERINSLVDFEKYDLVQINSQLFLKVCRNNKDCKKGSSPEPCTRSSCGSSKAHRCYVSFRQ